MLSGRTVHSYFSMNPSGEWSFLWLLCCAHSSSINGLFTFPDAPLGIVRLKQGQQISVVVYSDTDSEFPSRILVCRRNVWLYAVENVNEGCLTNPALVFCSFLDLQLASHGDGAAGVRIFCCLAAEGVVATGTWLIISAFALAISRALRLSFFPFPCFSGC